MPLAPRPLAWRQLLTPAHAFAETQRTGTMKKGGAGKGNWGKAGDDLDEDLALDENDPGYDSAEELFGKAFGSSPPSGFSWDQVNDISNDDNEAMNEIEAAIKDAWLTQVTKEVAECQDDAEEFFNKS